MIALVGYGYWGRNLARNFARELAVICEADTARQQAAQDLYPHVTISDDFQTVLKDTRVKAVVIATKAASHFELARQAIEQGLDVWIEKPVCQNITESRCLQELAIKHGSIVFVDHTFCYNPAVEQLRNINIGRPLYYDSTRISLGLFQADVDALLDLAIHDLSIINYLYPDLQLRDKSVTKNRHINEQANQVIVNLAFDNGFTAMINCNWVSPVKKREIILAGSERSVIYNDIDVDKIKIYETGMVDQDYNANKLSDMHAPRVPTTEALWTASRHFLDCCQSRRQPVTNLDSALKIMGWVL